jgi:hypothetical protein
MALPEVIAVRSAIFSQVTRITAAYSTDDLRQLFTYTRNWIQYGLLGFTVACILIGAVEHLFGG